MKMPGDETTPTLSEIIAQHVSTTQFSSLPEHTLVAAKRLILDTLAVAWAGSGSTGIDAVSAALSSSENRIAGANGEKCTLWGTAEQASVQNAAFINGAAAAALDYDALHLNALVHSSIVTLPPLLALSEHLHLDGKALLTALVLADDINCRLGLSAQGHNGWFFTSIFGVFGTAAACAKLLGLDQAGIANALGIALFQVTGTQQSMIEKKLTKRFMSAFAARGGVFSAMLAQAGVDAPRRPFEGEFGLFRLYQKCDAEILLEDLGTRYENSFISIKKFPSCGCAHALTEAALLIVERHRILPKDIARVTVRISEFMNRLVGGQFNPEQDGPQVTGQFSAQYAVACVIFRKRFIVDDIQSANVMEHEVANFARSVVIELDPENTGQLVPAEVIFEMRSGAKYIENVARFPGGESGAISKNILHDKVYDCMRQGPRPLIPEQIERLINRVEGLETMSDMADLFKNL